MVRLVPSMLLLNGSFIFSTLPRFFLVTFKGRMRLFLESELEKFSLNFLSPSVNFKMASTSRGGYGGKRINSEQKRIFKSYSAKASAIWLDSG